MASSLTRGPLPASVYWRRRIVLLGGALALVLLLGQLLGGGSDGSSDDPGAQQVSGEQSSAEPTSPGASKSTRWTKPTRKPLPAAPINTPTTRAPVLAVPDGPCADDDISVTPSVAEAVVGRDVTIQLDVRTIVDEACTWRVSPAHLSVAISSGSDPIWSTQQCPAVIPVQDLIVRRAETSGLTIVWKSARRSDEDCSRRTDWAMPGYYHVAAAALGGEPVDVQFRLTKPEPEVIVETTPPTPQGSNGPKGGQGKPGGKPTGKPGATASPSGAVEPNG